MTAWKVTGFHAVHSRSHNNGRKVTAVVSIEAVAKDLKEPKVGDRLDPRRQGR